MDLKVSFPIMNQPLPKGFSMESQSYLGNSRVVLNHYDVSTQADIQHTALSYESEDENMGRFHSRGRRGTPLYSKQDIREQYCISDRGLGALEADRRSLFSCLSTHQNSPCSTKASILTVCVKQKIPSDENLQDLLKRYPFEYASYHRRARYPWGVPPPEIYPFDEEMECSYFRRKPRVDPRRYTWMPADDESIRLERPRSVLDHCSITPSIPPPPPPATRPKHVSFARSHTLTSFDDTVVTLGSSSSYTNKMSQSQERLLPLLGFKRSGEFPLPITQQPSPNETFIISEKFKRTPASMKTQATQTEVCLGRKPLPPGQLNLSPRTIHRVKMVSQGAQTNGLLLNGRKLMKSYSEAGGRFAAFPYGPEIIPNDLNHEPLQRTQSDEPPRSPFLLKSPPAELHLPENDSSSSAHSDHEVEEYEKFESKIPKEIIIDFEPQLPFSPVEVTKKRLLKTVSDGEMLLDQRRFSKLEDDIILDKRLTSISHENIKVEPEPRSFIPYFQNSPIKNEGIFKHFDENVFSSVSGSFDDSGLRPQDSIDEEFHENLIYRGRYLRRSGSSTSDDILENELRLRKGANASPEGVVPSLSLLLDRCSPFASSDSLANDIRDHSDGIWNESQATVLQVDSGTDNGTAYSSSEMASLTTPSNISTLLLTPSSRRKHLLLMQHQQRSSMDTEALDEELPDQVHSTRVSELPSISLSRPESSIQQYLTPRAGPSPARRRRTPDPPMESPLPAVVPDLLLNRTDSGKTNTDVSESTTTTDDYITANSGTDSSKKNGSQIDIKEKQPSHTTQEGSSFESVSSVYGLGKNDLGDDMVVPSFSPLGIPEETSDVSITPVHITHHGRSSPSGSSSSSGSYSINGSCPDLPHKPPVPSSRHVPSISEDERSAHYSSSGYYESPLEDERTCRQTWRSTKSDRLEWTEDEKKRRKKTFTLDIDKHRDSEVSARDKQKTILKQSKKSDDIALYSKDFLKTNDKQRRTKVRTRSPLQAHRKNHQLKKLSPSLIRNADQFIQENNVQEKKLPLTSDESSSGVCGDQVTTAQISPRRNKKFKDNNRRKSVPRSPTGSRARRKSIEDQPSSLPNTLPRRRSSMQANIPEGYSKSRLSPHSISPIESPSKKKRSPKTSPESVRLKALSAESLRSVSPGSDSVFYSDPSSHMALTDHHVHCLHCGKEVDIVTTDEPGKRRGSSCHPADIVQPPASFADSPRVKQGRLYKKFEKRFRSEERSQGEKKHYRYRQDVRAKSEERGVREEAERVKLRPMARSTDSGVEGLRAADSSPSVLPAAPENEDDLGVYNVPYVEGYWIYIDDREELQTWIKPEITGDDDLLRRDSLSSTGSTESEHEFRKRYQAVTHRMVHRKSCLEMYKRQASKSFESDKTVIVQRISGEFGFRIHGSKPVVVSAIELDTPAESSGLEVGDIVLAVNRISVIDKSHSEVVKIAHAGSDTLTLEVARTCGVLSPTPGEVPMEKPLFTGYLWKLGGYINENSTTTWVRRWFVLKNDNCLYIYKNDIEKQPVGALMLINYDICKVDNSSSGVPARPCRFDLKRSGSQTLHLAADSDQSVVKWIELLSSAVEKSQMTDLWLEQTRKNLFLASNAIQKPDCFGYLVKLGNQWKSWSKRYCVLKDACLYFYQDVNAKNAFGVACLHGYRVQQTTAGAKKHAFEVIPSDPNQKHFYFYTESDADRKRWVAALEYSIDRWLKVG